MTPSNLHFTNIASCITQERAEKLELDDREDRLLRQRFHASGGTNTAKMHLSHNSKPELFHIKITEIIFKQKIRVTGTKNIF